MSGIAIGDDQAFLSYSVVHGSISEVHILAAVGTDRAFRVGNEGICFCEAVDRAVAESCVFLRGKDAAVLELVHTRTLGAQIEGALVVREANDRIQRKSIGGTEDLGGIGHGKKQG